MGCKYRVQVQAKNKNWTSVMGLFTPIKQEGKFMEHFLSTYDPCTTFFTNIFYFNGLNEVQLGCRFGCSNGASVVQAPGGGFSCTLKKKHEFRTIAMGCKGAGR